MRSAIADVNQSLERHRGAPSPVQSPDAGRRPDTVAGFILKFVFLAVVSGATIGMAKLMTTLYALHLGASAAQIGAISSMESLGMAIFTLPAGFLIARFGARRIYGIASIGPLLLNLLIPLASVWYWIALTQLLIGFCIPFRVVSMNSAFLDQLKHIGLSKAGWYRAALSIGMGLCGPFAANTLSGSLGYGVAFCLVAASFGGMALFAQSVLPDVSSHTYHTNRSSANSQQTAWREIRTMLASPDIGESCLIEFVGSAARALYSTFIVVIVMQSLRMDQSAAISLIMIEGVVSVCALLGLGYAVAGVALGKQYAASLLLSIGGLALLGTGHSFFALGLGAVLLSLGGALIHLINMGQLSQHSMNKSKISSLVNTASMAGAFFGAMAGGALGQRIGLQNVFLIAIPIVLGMAWLCRHRVSGQIGMALSVAAVAGVVRRASTSLSLLVPSLLLLAVWTLLAVSGALPEQMLPTPWRVLQSGVELWQSGELQEHLGISMQRLALGFISGAIAGVGFGLALGLSRTVRDYCGPLFEVLRNIPTVALIPVFILFFGIGEPLKILIVAKGVFFSVALAAADGVKNIPAGYFEVGRLYRISTFDLIRQLVLPAATPSVLTGLRIGLARSWMMLLLTEAIAAESGIGQLMELGRQLFRMDQVLLCIVLTGAIGFALDQSLRLLEKRLLQWRPA